MCGTNSGCCVGVGGIGGQMMDGCESEEKVTGALFSASLVCCSCVEAGGGWMAE